MTVLSEFEKREALYKDFTARLEHLVAEVLSANGLVPHTITSRCKARESLELKVKKNENKYGSIQDITDVAGVRVITYFEDDVRKVADIVESEFAVDAANSSDKRELLDPDRFGYLSLHYVVGLSPARLGLAEYRKFRECRGEIQIRSILQHAWAEIEHDLGYKTKIEVPRAIRRRFSRIAGLLELVDQEFVGIRGDLKDYADNVSRAIEEQPQAVEINSDSLLAFISKSDVLRAIDERVAKLGNTELHAETKSLRELTIVCAAIGIQSIGALEDTLKEKVQEILKLASFVITDSRSRNFAAGISIFYLAWVTLVRDPERLEHTFHQLGISDAPAAEATRKLVDAWQKSRESH